MPSAGGVKLISGTRRITLDNTLDERLRLLEDRVRPPSVVNSHGSDISAQMLPEIRHDLFGPNENRKFFT
jgi:V-type H+-transporting ATPase subunit E